VAEMKIKLVAIASPTLEHMLGLLQMLANGYSRRWTTVSHTPGVTFVSIEAEMPTPPQVVHLPEARGVIRGHLEFGDKSGTTEDRFAGFSARLSVGFEYSDQGALIGNFQTIRGRRYPCAHVPLTVPEVPETSRIFTSTIQLHFTPGQ
jgi:hypothetical protein